MTVLVQIPLPWFRALRRFDVTGHLLPRWNFFAPKPAGADIDLCYRYVLPDAPSGSSSGWARVDPDGSRRWWNILLHPHRRSAKAIVHCCNRILQAPKGGSGDQAKLAQSVPYLLLLDRVTALCPGAVAVQFRIEIIRPDGPNPTVAFQSPMHFVELPGEAGCH